LFGSGGRRVIDNLIQQGFLAERKSGLGGTDAGIIAGVSTFKTPLTLYYEKRGEIPDQYGKGAENVIRWGKLLEPLIRKYYREVTGRMVRNGKFLRHALFPFLCGHLDGTVWRKIEPIKIGGRVRRVEKGVLEIKTAFFTKRREWETRGVPDSYYLQAQHYLGISGLAFVSFAVLFGGSEFEFFDVARDQRVIDLLFAAEVEFWDRIQRSDPPSASFDALGAALARALYPVPVKGSEVILTDAGSQARMAAWLRLRTMKKKIEDKIKEHETWLMFQMGTAERAYILGTARAKWAAGSRRAVDFKLLESVYPDAYAAAVSVNPSRRLSIVDLADADEREAEIETPTAERSRRKIVLDYLD
jgi:putative phage-type endonuclease